MTSGTLPAETRIGHVHLKVAELDRAIQFYRDFMGFDLLQRFGVQAAFLSAGGYHHHIGLNTWESAGGQPPAPGTTGLYHFAINYPTRRDLAAAVVRLLDNGWGIDGASDHGTHEAVYLHDPDFNGLELAWDRDRSAWTDENGLCLAAGHSTGADCWPNLADQFAQTISKPCLCIRSEGVGFWALGVGGRRTAIAIVIAVLRRWQPLPNPHARTIHILDV
jgi:catechol 2,3-dioxygenase